MTMLLTILKIIGIVLLVVLLTILVLLLLVLFVPVRYEARGTRRMEDDVPARITVKAHWLLHIINVSFRYPEAAFVRVRLFCFTLFSTEPKPESEEKRKEEQISDDENKAGNVAEKEQEKQPEKISESVLKKEQAEENASMEEGEGDAPGEISAESTDKSEEKSEENQQDEEDYRPKFFDFLGKIFQILKNIQYTIRKICDKIKHIIQNIRYYINVIQSNAFRSAWGVCSGEVISLLRSIRPRKLEGSFTVGTGDPATTAQILAVHGMLYPLIGEHIIMIPDFERFIIEGQFLVKGRITLFRFLKTAGRLFFHKDLRKVIRLFKKGGSTNGR